jgi:hypothetical protein
MGWEIAAASAVIAALVMALAVMRTGHVAVGY